jgi:flagella basal body P-ring formation protein FlgA
VVNRMYIFCICLLVIWVTLASSCISKSMADSSGAENALKVFLENNYPWEKIEVSNVRFTGNMHDQSPEQITVEKGPLGKGIFSFMLENSQKVIVKADVRALGLVVKSMRPLRKGYVLQDDDLYLSEMYVSKMPKSAVKDPEDIIGKPLKRTILADMVIVEEMVEKTQIVKKGRRVVLLISGQGFNISAIGETKEKGYVGTQVRAVNLSSKKEVRGVLIDENTVKVEL